MTFIPGVRMRVVIVLRILALHSGAIGLGLLLLPPGHLELFGLSSSQGRFFPMQGGVFHLVVSFACILASIRLDDSPSLLTLIVTGKFAAVVFLLAYYRLAETSWVVLSSAVGDAVMGLAVLLTYRQYRRSPVARPRQDGRAHATHAPQVTQRPVPSAKRSRPGTDPAPFRLSRLAHRYPLNEGRFASHNLPTSGPRTAGPIEGAAASSWPPSIVVTGASGFIGRHFLEAVKDDFKIYAIARRSQKAAGVSMHPNIKWMPADIGEREAVARVMGEIAQTGGADYLLHLAAYYDFSNEDNIEYARTNVDGTRHILQYARKLKRFIFASSVTVTSVADSRVRIDEQSPADATFPYARSKIACERLIREYSETFPCTIVRQAAIFSDWCEYGPLYVFLSTWASRRWNRKVLAGRGLSAVPYLHINDLIELILSVICHRERLPQFHICVASPDGCTSHKELFKVTARYNYFVSVNPWLVPKWLAFAGVALRDLFGRMAGNRPFERPWMVRYVDRQMDVDASQTRRLLSWAPISRFHIKRRLMYLIENMKSNPYEWHRRNREVFNRRTVDRPNLRIYETMVMLRQEIVRDTVDRLTSAENAQLLRTYQGLSDEQLVERVAQMCEMLEDDIRTGDRRHIMGYAHELAKARFDEGFASEEVIGAVQITAEVIVAALLAEPRLKHMEQSIHDETMLTLQLVIDEIEDTFESLTTLGIKHHLVANAGRPRDT